MDASLLAGWDNFYVITGSAAGGLMGLTFVVIALIVDGQGVRPSGLRAFITPTIVHFGAVLALSAYLSMPHQHVITLSLGFGVAGAAGVIYGAVIAANMHGHPGYTPVREDWVFNVIVPTVLYGCLLALAVVVWHRPTQTLYAVATLLLILLFIGIHNAWDIAVWVTLHRRGDPPAGG
jgi:hypothetical protein